MRLGGKEAENATRVHAASESKIDEQGVVWCRRSYDKQLLVAPTAMVPDLLALVPIGHGDAGPGAVLSLIREIAISGHQWSCSCRR